MDGNRGNLSFVAINLINQKTFPFLRDDRKRVVFLYTYICEILLEKLEISSLFPSLLYYIFS